MKAVQMSDTYKVNELNMKVNVIKYAIKLVLETMNIAENDSSVDLDGSAGDYFDKIKKILEGVIEL